MAFKFENNWIDVEHYSGRAYEVSSSSSTTEYSTSRLTTFWLDQPDLPPRQFKFGAAIPILTDHAVSILYIGWRDEKNVMPVAIFNRTTKQLFVSSPEKLISQLGLPADTMLGLLSAILTVGGLVMWPLILNFIYQNQMKGETPGWIGFGIGVALLAANMVYHAMWKERRLTRVKAGVDKEILERFGFGADIPTGVSLVTLSAG